MKDTKMRHEILYYANCLKSLFSTCAECFFLPGNLTLEQMQTNMKAIKKYQDVFCSIKVILCELVSRTLVWFQIPPQFLQQLLI